MQFGEAHRLIVVDAVRTRYGAAAAAAPPGAGASSSAAGGSGSGSGPVGIVSSGLSILVGGVKRSAGGGRSSGGGSSGGCSSGSSGGAGGAAGTAPAPGRPQYPQWVSSLAQQFLDQSPHLDEHARSQVTPVGLPVAPITSISFPVRRCALIVITTQFRRYTARCMRACV